MQKWANRNKKTLAVILAISVLSIVYMPIITSSNNSDNQTTEITIINVHSRPLIGNKWTVMFTTIGQADLTIKAVNETTWSNTNNVQDLKFLELKRGDETIEYEWINNSVYIANFSANETCYETSKVLTIGVHTLMFKFGNHTVYAHNDAWQSWWNSSWQYRKRVNVTTGANSPYNGYEGYTVRITGLNTSNASKFQGDGDDIRVVYWNGTDYTELNREIRNPGTSDTTVIFKLQANISANGNDDNYYLYYGNSSVGAGPSNKTYVYLWFDNVSYDRESEYIQGGVDQSGHGGGDWANSISRDAAGYYTFDTDDNYGDSLRPSALSGSSAERDVYVEFMHYQTNAYSTDMTSGPLVRWDGTGSGSNEDSNHWYCYEMADSTFQGGSYGSHDDITSDNRGNVVVANGALGVYPGNQWNRLGLSVWGTNPSNLAAYLELDVSTHDGWMSQRFSGTDNDNPNPGQVGLWLQQDAGRVDNILIRRYTEPEPTTSLETEQEYDGTPPTSSVNTITPYWQNTTPITINATASDNGGSGVNNVTLYWYNSTDNNTWSGPWNYGTDTQSPWSWSFNFSITNGSGYYRFYSIATDNLSNTESVTGNDTMCGYDTTPPSSQVDNITPYWQNASDNPTNITVTSATDDLGITNISLYYRYRATNSSSWGSWTLFSKDENSPWNWSFNFSSGDGHYQFYSRANDSAGKLEDPPTSPDNDTRCGYDTIKPSSEVDNLSQYWYNETDKPLTINVTTATDTLSGLKNITLYYRYRIENGSSWESWQSYGTDTSQPWQWSFNFPKSKGHYQFYSMAVDNASNYEDPPTAPDNDTECGYNTSKPYSEVDDITPYWHNTSPLTITAQATDFSGTGLKNVTLYYYNSSDNNIWNGPTAFDVDTDPWIDITWNFDFPNGTGYYRLYSIAIDNDSNVEDFTGNDTECGYDTVKPSSKIDDVTPYWQNASDNPLTINVTGSTDDLSGVHNISLYYRYRATNSSGWGSWTYYSKDENSPWSWGFNFPTGDGHYQFHSRANDTAGNMEDPPTTPDNDTECGYDTAKPDSTVDNISPYWKDASDNPLDITVTSFSDSLSGVKNISLYYRFRTNNESSWGSWVSYGVDENSPWSWSFNFPTGDGHYQFYSRANDSAGNMEDPPTTPDNDTECGYDTSGPTSYVNTISPYEVTSSLLEITATATNGVSGVKNVTLWYTYSANANWWNYSWNYRKKLTFNNSGSSENLENFTVLVKLDSSNFNYSKAETDGSDIRFIDSDSSAELKYHIEEWNTSGDSFIWVRLPQIDSGSTTDYIWMYYNNSAANDAQDAEGTYESNFAAVYHLNETTGTYRDSTSNDEDSTAEAPNSRNYTGISGKAPYFDTNSDYIHFPDTINDGQFTVELWFKPTWNGNDNADHALLDLTNDPIYFYLAKNSGNNLQFYFESANDADVQINYDISAVITSDNWYYMVGVGNFSSSGPHLMYLDSSQVGSDSTNVNQKGTLASSMRIGSPGDTYAVPQGPADAVIDEIRISNIARSLSWINASYKAINNQYITYGGEENFTLTRWNNANNPDTSSPWSWIFNFPEYTDTPLYYDFYSIANDTARNMEGIPTEKDTQCYYNPNPATAPTINSYNLTNNTGSKLNNQTGLLDVNKEYTFTINITDLNEWVDIEYINITAWYDNGSDSTTYNQTGNKGGNLNMKLQYENTTGTANWRMIWPDDEATLVLTNCTETIINTTTRIINISFKPLSQIRWAPGDGAWDTTQNTTNDPYSWNFNITVTDTTNRSDYKRDEYGVYRYTSILPDSDWVDVYALPGFNDESSIVTVTYSSNYDYNMTIYFEENLTHTIWDWYTISIADNVTILADADPNDDITSDINFTGIGEANAIDIFNVSGVFQADGVNQTVQVQFKVYIPLGTMSGKYTAHVATKISHD